MDKDEPTDYYGTQTAYAVQLFQRKHELKIDGIAGETTIALLNDAAAKKYTVSLGINGTDVKEIQKRLIELRYLKSGATGYFGTDTETAVKAFQKQNGLTADGNVGSQTRELLYSDDAKPAPTKAPAKSSAKSSAKKTTSASASKSTEKLNEDIGTNAEKVSVFIEAARAQLGKKYVRAGKGPDVFDCSGFVYYALNQSGYKIGYMTSAGWAKATRFAKIVTPSKIKKGDILCFSGHVGIYLGDGQMIDASSGAGCIRIATNIWNSTYWKKNFICARRVLTD